MIISGSEGTIAAACITAGGYFALARRQKPIRDNTKESTEQGARIETRLNALGDTLIQHAIDDAANFREVRDVVFRRRRRRVLLPVLALVSVVAFLRRK